MRVWIEGDYLNPFTVIPNIYETCQGIMPSQSSSSIIFLEDQAHIYSSAPVILVLADASALCLRVNQGKLTGCI